MGWTKIHHKRYRNALSEEQAFHNFCGKFRRERGFLLIGKKIMVAEDDVFYQRLIHNYLTCQGFNVMVVGNGSEVITEYRHFQPDLLLLDIIMPGMDGFEVCRIIREESSLPIIMLSAKDKSTDKIIGFSLGCDDYITKPFENTELLLRIKAVLRRVKEQTHLDNEPTIVKLPGLTISRTTRVTEIGGREINLTPKEFALLWLLSSHPGQVFTRKQILYQTWDSDYYVNPEVVTTLVKRLREKIEPDVSNPYYIKTIHGVGYKLGVKPC